MGGAPENEVAAATRGAQGVFVCALCVFVAVCEFMCVCVRCVCLWLCVMVVPCLKVDIGLLVLARTWSVCAVDLKERRGLVFEYLSGHFYVWW
jgi:hypothetical protein